MSLKHDFIGQQEIPQNVVMPAISQTGAEIVMISAVGIATLIGLRNLLAHKDARLLICMVAGFAACLMETHTMAMLKFVYPQTGQHMLYFGLGKPVPVYLGFTYSMFFGFATYAYINKTASGWSAKSLFTTIAVLVFLEAVMEIICLNLGLWAYFDDQPFTLFDFPIHVAVIVACISCIYGALLRLWFQYVQGPQQFLMIIFGPMILVGTFTAGTYPIHFSIESSGGLIASRIGSAMAMSFSIIATYYVVRALAHIP